MSRIPRNAIRGRKGLAAYFGVSVSTVGRWIALGLPVHRVGARLLWADPDEVDAWEYPA